MNDDLKILIADDHQVIVDLVSSLIKEDLGANVFQARDFEGVNEILTQHPDIQLVLLDYGMPGVSGVDSVKKLVNAHPNISIALFTGNESKALISNSLVAGVKGVILKNESAASISEIVRFILQGHIYTPPDIFKHQEDDRTDFEFTERELEMLECLRIGMTNKEIGIQKNLSDSTVKLHIRTLCGKLGAKNRTQAVMLAEEFGL